MIAERIDALKTKLNDSRARLDSILNQVGDRWETQVYSEGAAWNIRQLLIHLTQAESGMLLTMKSIAQGGEGSPADFDIERYNRRSVEKRAEQTPEQSRSAMAANRAATLEWLSTMDEETFNKIGRHATLLTLSLEQFFNLIADHERLHADDIAKVLNIP